MAELNGGIASSQNMEGHLAGHDSLSAEVTVSQGISGSLSVAQGITGNLSAKQGMTATMSNNINLKMQSKDVTPTDEPQTIVADAGFVGLSQVNVEPIPSNYGKITWNGSFILVS